MTYQLQYQFQTGKTQPVAQRDVLDMDEVRAFVKDTAERFPLPPGAVWLMVTEDSPDFVPDMKV